MVALKQYIYRNKSMLNKIANLLGTRREKMRNKRTSTKLFGLLLVAILMGLLAPYSALAAPSVRLVSPGNWPNYAGAGGLEKKVAVIYYNDGASSMTVSTVTVVHGATATLSWGTVTAGESGPGLPVVNNDTITWTGPYTVPAHSTKTFFCDVFCTTGVATTADYNMVATVNDGGANPTATNSVNWTSRAYATGAFVYSGTAAAPVYSFGETTPLTAGVATNLTFTFMIPMSPASGTARYDYVDNASVLPSVGRDKILRITFPAGWTVNSTSAVSTCFTGTVPPGTPGSALINGQNVYAYVGTIGAGTAFGPSGTNCDKTYSITVNVTPPSPATQTAYNIDALFGDPTHTNLIEDYTATSCTGTTSGGTLRSGLDIQGKFMAVVASGVAGTPTTVGTVTSGTVTDTSVAISATYTGNAEANGNCVYKYNTTNNYATATTAASCNNVTGASPRSCTITGLAQNTTYYIWADYADPDGVTGGPSVQMAGTVTTTNTRTITTGATVTGAAASSTSVNVTASYTGNSDVDGNCVFKYNTVNTYASATTSAACNNVTGASPRACTITGLTANTTYYIWADYADPDGLNGATYIQMAGTVTTPSGPVNGTTVGTVTGSAASTTAINVSATLTGDANANGNCVFLYNTVNNVGTATTSNCNNVTGASPRNCTITGLTPSTPYYIWATYADADGVTGGPTVQMAGTVTTLAGIPCDSSVSNCTDCHAMPPTTAKSHDKHTFTADRKACAICHYNYKVPANVTSTTKWTVGHTNGYLDVYTSNHVNNGIGTHTAAGGYYSGYRNKTSLWDGKSPATANNTCTNTYCHGAGASPVWGVGTTTCATCHVSPPIDKGSHAKHNSGDMTGKNSSSGTTYNFGCYNCHNPAQHASGPASTNAAAYVSFANTSTPAYKGLPGPTYTVGGTNIGPDSSGRNVSNATCTMYCHSDGNGGAPKTVPTWGTANANATCTFCHNGNKAAGVGNIMASGSHTAHVNNTDANLATFSCVKCHNTTVSADRTISNSANHVNGTKTVKFDATNPLGNYSSTVSGCRTVYCHSSGQAVTPTYNKMTWGGTAIGCNGCHGVGTTYGEPNYSNVSTADRHSYNGHYVSNHVSSQASCSMCHWGTVNVLGNISTNTTKHIDGSRQIRFRPDVGGTYDSVNKYCSGLLAPCHSGTRRWGGTGQGCVGCHAAATGTRRIAATDFGMTSHHIVGAWAAVTNKDCAACHAEGNYADGSTSGYHTGVSGHPVYLKRWTAAFPAAGTNGTFSVISTSALIRSTKNNTVLTAFCTGCHNDTNASATPFHDGFTPENYSWDGNSIDSKYNNAGTTPWGKFNSANYNVVPDDTVTKSFSPHGNPGKNKIVMSVASFATYSATRPVACFDCHNSHGSAVTGGTSYTSQNANGGILVNRNGYVPAAGGSAGTKNVFGSDADICFDCHLGDVTGALKTYTSFGLPKGRTVAGNYYDRVGNTRVWSNWSTTRWSTGDVWRGSFAYKDGNFKGGHFGNSLSHLQAGVSNMGNVINGHCTACHDPHGVSGSTTTVTKPVRTLKISASTNVPTYTGTYTNTIANTGIYVVQVASTTQYKVSGNGGKNWTALVNFGTAATATNGLTVTLPTGTYSVDDTWTFLASGTVTPQYMVPALKGTWMASPYKEDRAPRSTYTTDTMNGGNARLTGITNANDYTAYQTTTNPAGWSTAVRLWDDTAGGTSNTTTTRAVGGPAPRANPDFRTGSYVPGYNVVAVQGGGFGQGPARAYGAGYTAVTQYEGWNGYFIDENTFGSNTLKGYGQNMPFANMSTRNANARPGNFAGLCLQCHAWSRTNATAIALSNVTSANLATTTGRVVTKPHETVMALGSITVDLFKRAQNWGTNTELADFGMHKMWYNNSSAGRPGPASPGNGTTSDPNSGTGQRMHYYRWGVDGTNQATSGTIQATYHQFPCSKCHTPHVSRLPRLMKTNCLDNDNVGTAHTDMGYVADNTTLPGTAGAALPGALVRNVACHSTKISYTNGSSTYYPGGWNNKTPW